TVWNDLREFRWVCSGGPLIKIALNPTVLPLLYRDLQTFGGVRIHVSSGGNVAFCSFPANSQVHQFDQALRPLGLPGVTLRGQAPLWLGAQSRPSIARAVKQALDPENRFPGLDD